MESSRFATEFPTQWEHFATPLEHFEKAGETFESDYRRIYHLRDRKREFIQDYIETTYGFCYDCFALRFECYERYDVG
jgi:hypothetical protein